MNYIEPKIAEEIKNTAQLYDVISDYVQLKKTGTAYVGTCPVCNAKKGLQISVKKHIWKCFKCDTGGNSAVSFLMKVEGKDYPEALLIIADKYNISIESEKQVKQKKARRNSRKQSFRDSQLRASGIPINYQKYKLHKGKLQYEYDRYQKGTIDSFWNFLADGDDMILHYIDLESKPMKWKTSRGKEMPLMRVRWANPSLHLDKEGKPAKYKSPYQSGSHLWIPNHIVLAYQSHKIIDTLYICEGEKKADKMCLEGLDAVGIMGIHNFASAGEMPYHFEKLIKTCAIRNMVFVLDADWQEISTTNLETSVDQRPKTFFKAVIKFRDYFRAFYNEGIELELFFMYHHDQVQKGIDDLLVNSLMGKEKDLIQDINKAMVARDGKGRYVNLHKITEMSSYKLKEFWNLHATPAFFNSHKEKLQQLREFKFKQLKWRWNPDEKEFELTQKLMPNEQFWKKISTGEDKHGNTQYKYQFNYVNILNFLRNRGFGIYEYSNDQFRFVYLEGKVIRETTAQKIQRYVMDFTREIDELDVLELLLRGGKQYLGPDKLGNMFYIKPEFHEAKKDVQFLYFKNCYWKITATEIKQRPLSELPKHVWGNKIIDFEPKYLSKPMVQADQKAGKWGINMIAECKDSDIARFYRNTSSFYWKKGHTLVEDKQGVKRWIAKENCEEESEEEAQTTTVNLVCKMLAAGYILHEYRDYGNMKAIICQDGTESKVGKSQGGTGKSLWSKAFQFMAPQEVIDGKKKNIEDDNHLYENVDERTQMIVFDDVRVNFNFEFLFSQITTGIVVNPKGEKRYKVLPPKFIINTNHAINGDGNSFSRRQYTIAFSDYYNKHRTVGDEFGHQLFHEWEFEQWNYFYNWMATCIQLYLQHGLQYTNQSEALELRKLRQQIGENFIEWADVMYDKKEGPLLNQRVEKVYACEKYLIQYTQDRRFVNPRKFKEKLKKYASYKKLDYNIPSDGERIKQNGKEYFVLSDTYFNASLMNTINDDNDISYHHFKINLDD